MMRSQSTSDVQVPEPRPPSQLCPLCLEQDIFCVFSTDGKLSTRLPSPPTPRCLGLQGDLWQLPAFSFLR